MIDFNKPVETTDGRPVRVLCVDKIGGMPVVCLIKNGQDFDDEERVYRANLDGELPDTRSFALRNVAPKPVKREGWINISKGNLPDSVVWKSEAAAKDYARGYKVEIQTVRIEWEEPAQ